MMGDLDKTLKALLREKRDINNSIHRTPYGMRMGEDFMTMVNRLEYIKERLNFARELKLMRDYQREVGIGQNTRT